jgi:hypothetical protein
MIFNISKGDSQGEFPHTLVYLLHHPFVLHNQNTTWSPFGVQAIPIYMMTPPQATRNTMRHGFKLSFLKIDNINLPFSEQVPHPQTFLHGYLSKKKKNDVCYWTLIMKNTFFLFFFHDLIMKNIPTGRYSMLYFAIKCQFCNLYDSCAPRPATWSLILSV